MNDFAAWSEDRAGWERSNAAKQSARPANDAEKKPRPKAEKPKEQERGNGADHMGGRPSPDARVVSFPIRSDFDLQVTMPKAGLTVAELRKVAFFLLPYTTDWDPATQAPQNIFPMLESRDER